MTTRLGLGLIGFSFSTAQGFWRWVDLCEEGGVDSIWQSDRLIGGPSLECLSTMAALAGATRRLKFGMSILALGWREPLVVAKACATIDFLSGGRLLPAFGVGSLAAPEWAALGQDPHGQGVRLDEALSLITRLWRGETVDFEGERLQTKGAWISPLPVQPELPLWIGGSSPAAVRRTVRFGTGWLGGLESPAEASQVVARIKQEARQAGRTIDPGHFGGGFSFRFGGPDDRRGFPALAARSGQPPAAARTSIVGDAAAILERIRDYEEAGVTKLILRPIATGDDDTIAQTRRLIEEVFPEV